MLSDRVSAKIDLKNIIIFAPLAVVTVFCLSFVQMKAVNTQKSMKQEAALSRPADNAKTLPLVTQPPLPKLETTVDIKTPPPVPPPSNPYVGHSSKPEMVGPSSKESGNALQPNAGNLNNAINNELQATRKAIRLEDAKL